MRDVAFAMCAAVAVGAVPLRAEEAAWRGAGRHVLVVHAAGSDDSRTAAEYYARRREVPAENLLGLDLARDPKAGRRWNYAEFFQRVLTPVSKRLAGKAGRDIAYIVTCPGVPMTMDTGHRPPAAEKGRRNWFARTGRRSVDQYLISAAANVEAGLGETTETDKKTKKQRTLPCPGRGAAGPLGAHGREVVLPLYGLYRRASRGRHIRRLRAEHPRIFDFRLVSRLGQGLDSARDMVDRALYAERHLRLPAGDEDGPRPEMWLDMKYHFAGDHVAAMSRLVPIVRGAPGSPFSRGEGLLGLWPVVIDTQAREIGSGNPGHKPTVTAKVAEVDATGLTLAAPGKAGRAKDAPGAYYFPPGWRVARVAPEAKKAKGGKGGSGPGTAPAGPVPTATIVGFDFMNNRLIVDSAAGFAAGDRIRAVWGGEFPATRCVIFYGFYGLCAFEDVRQFPPGALGVHVDSCCMNWARGAIGRGITATFGVTTEPLSAGIPYGDLLVLALARGYDWAEAVYGATRLGQRWAGVCFGDPLYAPFRSLQRPDRSRPVLGPVRVDAEGKDARLTASLAGKTDDELADVALFRLEYGPTAELGTTVDFYDWPDPASGKRVKGRRFGYSRHVARTLKGLRKGRVHHYRLTARDPAGLETTVKGTFTP